MSTWEDVLRDRVAALAIRDLLAWHRAQSAAILYLCAHHSWLVAREAAQSAIDQGALQLRRARTGQLDTQIVDPDLLDNYLGSRGLSLTTISRRHGVRLLHQAVGRPKLTTRPTTIRANLPVPAPHDTDPIILDAYLQTFLHRPVIATEPIEKTLRDLRARMLGRIATHLHEEYLRTGRACSVTLDVFRLVTGETYALHVEPADDDGEEAALAGQIRADIGLERDYELDITPTRSYIVTPGGVHIVRR